MSVDAASTPPVAMRGIVKRFDRFEALKGVDFSLRGGEIHGLLGENGAGKTTLMNILYGLLKPDAGTIEIEGKPVRLRSPQDAISHGIGMVHQHFMLVPTLTVAENMILGERGGALVRSARIERAAARIREDGERYGLEVDPSAPVWQLSVGEQQRVEILRALYRSARVLILDEPTASLTPPETEQLLPRLRALADGGSAVVFITHHLEEVLAWTDRITILRHGERVETLRPQETSALALARSMVGRTVSLRELGVEVGALEDEHVAAGEPVLTVSGIEARGDAGTAALRGVSLEAGAGEIVAVAGVEGNGQAELEEVLCGLRRPGAGSIVVCGTDVTDASTAARLKAGLGIIPSDRYRRGVIRALSVAENLVLDRIGEEPFGSVVRVRRQQIMTNAQELVGRFSIKVAYLGQQAGTLSGGNAQRLVLARALSRDVRCLIAAQPTRGLDVGAMEFVWGQLAAARKAGMAILLISTDLDEVMALADRCYVMYRGELAGNWLRHELDRERIGLAMGGVTEPEAQQRPAPAARAAAGRPQAESG
jgi:general nucleoside transport system ATP-binding protein